MSSLFRLMQQQQGSAALLLTLLQKPVTTEPPPPGITGERTELLSAKAKRHCTCACHTRPRKTSDFEHGVMDLLQSYGIPLDLQIKAHKWRFDAGIRGQKVLIEADGAFWHASPIVQDRDRRKDAWCKENGYLLFRVAEAAFAEDPVGSVRAIVQHWQRIGNG